ncbi:hypothetical protein CR164_11770 [Prosthecochloris marina]|uniref:Secreted protein n=2 Tax=Prosthecochloris marina TaxID=2017681 RepID=A0A317T4S2_9CHLB|nr:hypothetical protein CR164_11770 [Prosthecochloris marina]
MKKIFLFCFALHFAAMSFAVSTMKAQSNNSDGAVIGNFSDNAAANALETGSTAGQSAAGAPGPEDDEEEGEGENKDKDREDVIQSAPDQSEEGAFGPLEEGESGEGAKPRG